MADRNRPEGENAPIAGECAERTKCADRTERAIRSALNMMGYRENSEGMLRQKLARKGYTKDETDAAIAFLEKKGILREAEAIAHQVEYLANTMLYGKRRIVQMLLTKGYRREQIDPDYFAGIDFAENCKKRILRRAFFDADGKLPSNAAASLLRAGFSYAEIGEAVRLCRIEQDSDGE